MPTWLALDIQTLLLTLEGMNAGDTHGLEALFIQKLDNMHASWQVNLLPQNNAMEQFMQSP